MEGMLFVLGIAFALGFLLIFAASLGTKRAEQKQITPSPLAMLSFERFVRICQELAEAMKLEIVQVSANADDQMVDIYATNPTPFTGGDYLIHGVLVLPERTISAALIVELSNAIIQDRLSKGIFITTGHFTPDLPGIGELAPMEFIDGKRLEELAARYHLPLQVPA